MKRFFFIIITLCSCHHENISDIEVIKIDSARIQNLEQTSDTVFNEKLDWRDRNFYSLWYFVNTKTNDTVKIYKDSLQLIVAIIERNNEKNIFTGEYFKNGQLKGKVPYNEKGIRNGFGRYYYEDGRVESEGKWKNGSQTGKWKNYDKDGKLLSVSDKD